MSVWVTSYVVSRSGMFSSQEYGAVFFFLFFSSRRRHTRSDRDWSSDVCSSDLAARVTLDAAGADFELVTPMGRAEVRLPLLGRFNVANALGVAACAWGLGVPVETIEIGRASCRERV